MYFNQTKSSCLNEHMVHKVPCINYIVDFFLCANMNLNVIGNVIKVAL